MSVSESVCLCVCVCMFEVSDVSDDVRLLISIRKSICL